MDSKDLHMVQGLLERRHDTAQHAWWVCVCEGVGVWIKFGQKRCERLCMCIRTCESVMRTKEEGTGGEKCEERVIIRLVRFKVDFLLPHICHAIRVGMWSDAIEYNGWALFAHKKPNWRTAYPHHLHAPAMKFLPGKRMRGFSSKMFSLRSFKGKNDYIGGQPLCFPIEKWIRNQKICKMRPMKAKEKLNLSTHTKPADSKCFSQSSRNGQWRPIANVSEGSVTDEFADS